MLRSQPKGEFQTLHEVVHAARLNLVQGDWDYLIGGTESETTLRRNRLALDTVAFRPRVLRDVRELDSSAQFLGRRLRLPVMMAPIGSIETFVEGGGATAARAMGRFGGALMLSSVCGPGLEPVAEAAPDALRIYQLYVRGDRAWTDAIVRRAVDSGYNAFCLTVDTAWYSRRERDTAKRAVKPWRRDVTGFEFQMGLSWDEVKHFKDTHHDIPLILKGIATAEDAALACEHGVDCVYVSNHGGRQLDHGRGGLEVLPEVVDAVAGRARVIFDGGVMRGTDLVKARACGADMVGIGRLGVMGLAAGGEDGLVRTLELLEDEVRIAMGLLGTSSFEVLDRSYLHPAQATTAPHATSAFPLLDLDAPGY